MSEKQNQNRKDAPAMRGPMGHGHGNAGFGGKAKDFTGTIKRLMTYLKPFKILLLIVLILTILASIFNTVTPKLSGNITTSIQNTFIQRKIISQVESELGRVPSGATGEEIFKMMPEEYTSDVTANIKNVFLNMDFGTRPLMDYSYILKIVLIAIGLYAFSAIFNIIQGFAMADITQKTVYKMRNDVKSKLNNLPMKYFDTYTHGEILSRVTNDVDNISNTLQQSLSQIITSLVQIVMVIIMMLSISPILTLITIGTLPVIMFITIFIAKHSQKQFASNQKELGAISGHVEEMYTGHKIIKAYGREESATEKFDDINGRLYKAGWKSQFISGIIMPLTNLINNIGYLLICVVGGLLSTKGTLDLGGIVAFTQYSRRFTQPIVQVANIFNILQSTAASAERVFEVLDEKEELPDSDDAVDIKNPKGEVVFKNVKFGYEENKILISDMNIQVKPGQTVAIVGPTGAGKTTLVNLLMRFYELNSGSITIDGIDIQNIKRSSLRDLFGMVLQDTWLYSGTIYDNIAYGCESATKDVIVSAAKAAYVDNFVRTLSDGYNTEINEEASNISQGQKQLITIARAIISDPSILILDEATSSVDTRTELLIQTAMDKLMAGRTSFVIAHRLSTIRNADTILVMNHGDIIEQGSHSELMEKNGFYAELYNSQFANQKNNQSA